MTTSRKLDLVGKSYGKLIVEKFCGVKHGHRYWKCKCQCGNYRECCTTKLIKDKDVSCVECSFKKMGENIKKKQKHNTKYLNKGKYMIGITKKGEYFYFDTEDFNKIKKYNWWFNNSGYPVTKDKNRKEIFLHRLVMNCKNKNKIIDHINRERNDSRKINLRFVSKSQNCSNTSLRKDNSSNIIGVCKLRGKWQAYIQYNHKRYYLGVYENFENAVIARLNAERDFLHEFSPQKHLFKKYNIEV